MHHLVHDKNISKTLENLVKNNSLTVFSCFDETVPGTPELICESAKYANVNCYYFSKPQNIFKHYYTKRKGKLSKDSGLFIFATRFTNIKMLRKLQNAFLIQQLKSFYINKNYRESTLIYNNLESMIGVLPELKKMYKKTIYLCLDYSDLGSEFHANASTADKILVVPDSMFGKISELYPNKAVNFPQFSSTYKPSYNKYEKIRHLLKLIPKPRIIYTGNQEGRVDAKLYRDVAAKLKDCSFISFHNDNIQREGNIFRVPWLPKQEIFYLLRNSSVGFMPYDINLKHNLHCVPLKLFEYFQLGLPVVSSELINIIKYKPLLRTGSNTDEFVRALKSSLAEENYEYIIQRKKIGTKHSTLNQKDEIRRILNDT